MRNSSKNHPTPTELIAFVNMGAIGMIELRNWLAKLYPEFKDSRRDDVDQAIEYMGEELAKQTKAMQDWEHLGEDFEEDFA